VTKNHLCLDIEYQQLERFCQQLLTRSRDAVKTHESLITLQTFIRFFAASQDGSEQYAAIEALLNQFTEQTRQALLQQKAAELLLALHHQDVLAVTAIHTPLSRNGFYQILQSVIAKLLRAEIQVLYAWANAWTTDAKRRADDLSEFPDAPDFRAAGIDMAEYLAMVDVSRYLGSIIAE
jgi:site-specific recombinase XerD